MTTTMLNNTPVTDQSGIPDAGLYANNGIATEPPCKRTMTDVIRDSSGKRWADAAERLTRWTEERLLNRSDVYRSYLAMYNRNSGGTLSFTWPWPERDQVPGALSSDVIAKHYRDSKHNALIGVHALSAESTCKWFMIDIDQHDHQWHTVNETICKRAADAWCEQLQRLGFRPLLLDSNGAGGYYLLVCLSDEVPSQTVHGFVTDFVQNYADYGLTQAPTVFPSEPEVNPHRPYGSWWRLPGRHHTSAFWTKVWSGERWLEDQEAIEAMLNIEGDSPTLIPEVEDSQAG